MALGETLAEFIRQVSVNFGTEGSSGRSLTKLRIAFAVKMSRTSKPNTAKVQIYNASDDSVALLNKPEAVVTLLAGYDVPLQVFRGNPIESGVYSERNGPDRILTVELQDGQRQWSDDHVSTSYATQTTSGQIFDALILAIGLPTGTVDFDRTVNLPTGLVLHGSATEMLDSLTLSQGKQWFIRDGVIQVVSTGGGTGESAVVFSSISKNLIGAPVRTKNGVKVTGLLAPALRPGKPFRVISSTINGDYIADDVEFVGDSGYQDQFYVIATGRQL